MGILSKFSDLWPICWLVLGHTSVRNGHIFKNLKKDIDLRIGCPFENLKKGQRYEVQMSVK